LRELREVCRQDDQDWVDLEREMQQLSQDRAEHRSSYHAALLEAQRLAKLFRQAYQVSLLSRYGADPAMQQEVQRLRQDLTLLVGAEDAEGILNPAHKPWWLTAER
jgi:hypothetical protein